ncbi:hypothetical protein LF844_09910 [Metapseudomonas lalkuanensis]|uniref:hypothetical protein n=1 Tax=Metapseudomonas lalkuanensis TaxID=2604832 RepID=UPI001CF29CBD|nr:hypothetical protein [Pseudomonas lalkuanensis]UCP00104.1 hypothetical protein LF844_09910 [Pseudomonas lalkuanensis]
MTLAQERAATRAGITAARTNTLRRDLNSLETQRRQIRELVTLERKGLRPATKGRGTWDPNKPTFGGGGGGVDSPLTEPVDESGVPLREYHPSMTITSSDGLFTMELEPIKKLTMVDHSGRSIDFIYADPEPAPEPEP